MNWTYSINLHQMPKDDWKLTEAPDVFTLPIIDTLTGVVEAERYSHACSKAFAAISAEIKARRTAYGLGDLHVEQQSKEAAHE